MNTPHNTSDQKLKKAKNALESVLCDKQLEVVNITVKDTRSGSTMNLDRRPSIQTVDSNMDGDLLILLLYAKERFRISNAAYHEQEYIIKGRESILLYYSTVYQLFTGVSDLCNVIHNLRLRSLRSIAGRRDTCTTLAGHSICLLYTSPSPRDATLSRMPSSA